MTNDKWKDAFARAPMREPGSEWKTMHELSDITGLSRNTLKQRVEMMIASHHLERKTFTVVAKHCGNGEKLVEVTCYRLHVPVNEKETRGRKKRN